MEGFVYQYVNNINKKWYLGSHKGSPNDGYTASGIAINRAFDKYGIENFTRHILWCNNYREMEEYYLKKLDAANDQMSYNIKNDAVGGWDFVNSSGKAYRGGLKKGTKIVNKSEYHTKDERPECFKETIIDGIAFESRKAAAKHFNRSMATITTWSKTGKSNSGKTGPKRKEGVDL